MDWFPIVAIVVGAVAFIALTASATRGRGRRRRKGGLSGGLGGFGVLEEVFHPTAHEAQLIQEVEYELPAPAPLAGDKKKPGSEPVPDASDGEALDSPAALLETGDMNETPLPKHPIAASLSSIGPRWLLVVERTLPHPADAIWTAITDRTQVPRWAPFTPDRDLLETGEVALPEATATGEIPDSPGSAGKIITVATARMLSLTWDEDAIDFELEPVSADTASDTVMTLSHTFDDRDNAASYAAGWHLCLAALDGILQGLDVPRITGEAAKEHGWDELHELYGQRFDTDTEADAEPDAP